MQIMLFLNNALRHQEVIEETCFGESVPAAVSCCVLPCILHECLMRWKGSPKLGHGPKTWRD